MKFGDNALLTGVKYAYMNCTTSSAPFYRRGSLNEIVIGNDVEIIYNQSFNLCTHLETVSIGTSVEAIRNGAFSECASIREIYIYAKEPPHCYPDVFKETPIERIKLYVPESSYADYVQAQTWKDFGEIVSYNPSSINNIVETPKNAIRYDINGSVLLSNKKGFIIQKKNDSRGSKLFVR